MKYLIYIARIVVGSVFVVSGLIKANDALGFSYKLEEYFEPAALGSFWTFFEPYALPLAILVCVAEVVLGLSLLFGTKYKLTVVFITAFLVFFGFLTYYTAQCNPHEMVTYVNESGESITTARQCVLDCGCFGDALKGSLGRSLTPWESFKKDMILLFLTLFLFLGWKSQTLNNERRDKLILSGSLIFTVFFSGYVFGWWMPLSFIAIASLLYIIIKWFYVRKGREWVIIGMLAGISSLFIWYTLTYLPVKDYRPYAIGNNLPELMKSSDDYKEEFTNARFDKLLSKHSGDIENEVNQILLLDSNYQSETTSAEMKAEIKSYTIDDVEFSYKEMYRASVDSFVYDTMEKANLLPPLSSTLYYLQNKETKERGFYKSTIYMSDRMWETWEYVYILVNAETGDEVEILKSEYKAEEWEAKGYKKKEFEDVIERHGFTPKIPLDFKFPDNDAITNEILFGENYVLLVVSWDLNLANAKAYQKVNELYKMSEEKGYKFYAATSRVDLADAFIKNNKLDFGFVSHDDKILKTIVRSNPGVLLIKGGIVYGKWGKHTVPSPKKLEKFISKIK